MKVLAIIIIYMFTVIFSWLVVKRILEKSGIEADLVMVLLIFVPFFNLIFVFMFFVMEAAYRNDFNWNDFFKVKKEDKKGENK